MPAKSTKKKKVNTKKYTEKKGTAKKSTKNKKKAMSYITVASILFFVSVLLGIFTYINADGVVARVFYDVVFGLFSRTAYLLPIAVAGLGAYVVSIKSYDKLKIKSILLFIFVLSVSALIHIATGNELEVSDLYGYGMVGEGGGFLGGLFALGLLNSVGKVASIIILIFLMVALMSIILKVSIVTMVTSFVAQILGLGGEIKEEAQDAIEQTQKIKQKVKKVKKELKIESLGGKEIDFEIEEKKPEKIIDMGEVVFNSNFEPISSDGKVEKEEKPLDAPKEETKDSFSKDEKVSPITKEEQAKTSGEIEKGMVQEIIEYKFPPLKLLKSVNPVSADKRQEMRETAQKLMNVLADFNVEAKLLQVTQGPSVTRYEIQPDTGVKLSKITGLAEDIAWKLAVPTVLVAAVPGKAAVGIEVPNTSVATVSAREILESPEFKEADSKLTVAFGKDIGGNVVMGDIAKMPHVLIAGATGSGKSVCINTIVTSILYKAKPEDVKLIMVDPKVVELGVYNGIPHLLIPVVTDPKKAAGALNWAVQEMMKRYDLFAEEKVRNLESYNKLKKKNGEATMPKIVIIIDELADLMMVAAKEVEDSICRLAQLARAAGIHLIVATQRPSVDVITGLIKANVPSRIAFAVSSQVDSRTILDRGGAEKLLGKGDMLYYPSGMNTPMRVQGAFVSDAEIEKVVGYIKENCEVTHYSEDLEEHITRVATGEIGVTDHNDADDADELLPQAIELAVELGQISTAMIQRRLKVGYSRAGRIIDQMEERGIISGPNGSKPREVYANRISIDDYRE